MSSISSAFDEQSAVKYNASRPYSRDLWRAIQALVETSVDGTPGSMTALAVCAWQWDASCDLRADGKVGPSTLEQMGFAEDEGDDCEEPAGAERNRDTRRIVRDENKEADVDLAKYQPHVDWPTVARWSKIRGVIIKSTDGRGAEDIDPLFSSHWSGAASVDMPRGAYHVCHPLSKGGRGCPTQAARDHFDAVGDGGALGSWLDLETNHVQEGVDLLGAEGMADWLSEFIERLVELQGLEPGFYWSHRGVALLDNHAERFRSLRHWWAYYYSDEHDLPKLAARPPKPEGWPWYRWQFTSSGLCVGIEGRVDVNVLNASGCK